MSFEGQKIKVGVLGASGRAGSLVIKCLPEFPEYKLGAALVAPDCPTLGKICATAEQNEGSSVFFSSDLAAAVTKCDLFIDFSTPKSSLALARLCANSKKPLLVATTGFDPTQVSELEEQAGLVPILLTSNTSLGVFVLNELASLAQKLLGPEFQIEIFELHHGQKKDAPSGTAITLGSRLAAEGELQTSMRGPGVRGQRELGYASLRGGDVPGEHTVYFLGRGERIEITHRTMDRTILARGALKIAKRLLGRPPKLYKMSELL